MQCCSVAVLLCGKVMPLLRHAFSWRGLLDVRVPSSHQEQVAHLQAKDLRAIMVSQLGHICRGQLQICPGWYT